MRQMLCAVLLTAGALVFSQPAPQVALKLDPDAAKPGATVQATVSVTIPKGYHAYSNPPTGEGLIPLAVTSVSGAALKTATYPPGKMIEFGGEQVGAYDGTVSVQATLELPKDASGKHPISLTVRYQLCDDAVCLRPGEVAAQSVVSIESESPAPKPPDSATQEPTPPDPTVGQQEPEAPTQPDQQVAAEQEPQVGQPEPAVEQQPMQTQAAPGFEESFAARLARMHKEGAWMWLLPGFLLAGFILNLTPCVYPIIAPTAGFISKQSTTAPGGRVAFGLAFLIGAAAVFGALGTLFGATGQVFGALYQHAWFTVGLGVLMIALALAMFDVYQISLPAGLSSGLRGRAGLVGALMMGGFIGVAAVPCGGPVIAVTASLVFEARDVPFGMLAFTTMGIGLGLPVAVLIMTGALSVLARPGEWMVTVKHILGLAVIASGLYYFSFALTPLIGKEGMAWVWAAYLLGAALYLLVFDHTGRTQTGMIALKSVFALGAAFYAAIALQPALGKAEVEDVYWQPMDLAQFEQVLGSGKPVIVDFTADWCAKCKEIEAKTFSHPAVRQALRQMAAFKADGTSRTEMVASWERRFGVRSYPAVFFYDGEGNLVKRFDTFIDDQQFLQTARLAGVP
ncbi:MAG: thioredoxin family protein [Fimbriimonadia bacterium]|jgi:thiol:disulfide interchange protein DsbD